MENQKLVQAIFRQKIGMRRAWIVLLMSSAKRWRGACNGGAFKFGVASFWTSGTIFNLLENWCVLRIWGVGRYVRVIDR